ncbi:hypothetical protein WJU23_11415 [Prosthecobacter sp. SYSU 5D2]|uniref:hypothetical protein n=1 Tax=Prosthecobacter sp. SYSU 5D2 TaxID=3134134 RepID=UPI0031FF0F08
MKSVLLILALACLSLRAAPPETAKAEKAMFPADSRHWSQHAEAVVISDLSKALPADSLTQGRREKGKWKAIPYSTADSEGWALSCYAQTGAPEVRVPLTQKGWHAVYIGASTVGALSKEMRNGWRAKLSDEPIYRRMANNLALLPNRRDVIQEGFLTVADLNGQSVEFASLPGLSATLCYIKLVPLTDAEAQSWTARKPNPATRTSIATFDGHSWIWPFQPRTEADLRANFRGFENTDFKKWWFQVLGADLVTYPTKVGNLPGEDTLDFSSDAHKAFVESVKALHQAGINPLKVARDVAREQGVEFHIMLRPAGWKASMPYEETFDSKFYAAHPEWRCVDRDGSATMHMSHAFPEVRQHLLDILRETLELQPEGVGMLFNRGMPLMLWEKPFCDRFQAMHGADARTVPEDDPRIYATRAAIMTEFMQDIRRLLDETAAAQGRKERYQISLGTFSKEVDNQKWGIDLPRWIEKGLVDDLGVTWFAYHTSFAQPDMDYYMRLTKGTQIGVYPFVISWKTGLPQEFCKKITGFYQKGATGIAIWDPTVKDGWSLKPHGNLMDVISQMGDRSQMLKWAKEGVPLPLSIPLTRLDENTYSRWFPTTGF